jgi:hypothetical protein
MNKIKRNGNQILDANFSDETPLEIAEFSDNLTKDAKNKFITNHNFGVSYPLLKDGASSFNDQPLLISRSVNSGSSFPI